MKTQMLFTPVPNTTDNLIGVCFKGENASELAKEFGSVLYDLLRDQMLDADTRIKCEFKHFRYSGISFEHVRPGEGERVMIALKDHHHFYGNGHYMHELSNKRSEVYNYIEDSILDCFYYLGTMLYDDSMRVDDEYYNTVFYFDAEDQGFTLDDIPTDDILYDEVNGKASDIFDAIISGKIRLAGITRYCKTDIGVAAFDQNINESTKTYDIHDQTKFIKDFRFLVKLHCDEHEAEPPEIYYM